MLLLLLATTVQADTRIAWQGSFTDAERAMLTSWINESVAGVATLVGPFPFDVQVRIYRRDGSREPVPWANTRRGFRQGVNFYVDPGFDLLDFQSDWTAAHELSHLILPYLGEANAWFAEGFASYMQYQVMLATQALTPAEAVENYRSRLDKARIRYPYHDQPFTRAAPKLRQARQFPVMYWGGAAYFLQVDEALSQSRGTSLISILKDYLACCRRNQKKLSELVVTLDELSNSDIFSSHLETFSTRPGFPDYGMLESD